MYRYLQMNAFRDTRIDIGSLVMATGIFTSCLQDGFGGTSRGFQAEALVRVSAVPADSA